MDFERELRRLADAYVSQGYQVALRPTAEDLPVFARDFGIEILGRRGIEGVLVAVRKDRDAMAKDIHLTEYAEATDLQKGWRLDLAVLEAEKPNPTEIDGASDFSEADMEGAFAQSQELVGLGFPRPALVTAWAGFEAAMRHRLRAAGERAGWGSSPRGMINELYSNGVIGIEEFTRLESLFRVRNQIVHGFASSALPDGDVVQFLSELGRRLVEESRHVTLAS